MSDGDMPTPLEAWAFNVHLECSRPDDPLEVAIGGAVLNLRDLDAILSDALAAAIRNGEGA